MRNIALGFCAAGLLAWTGFHNDALESMEQSIRFIARTPVRAAYQRAEQLERAHRQLSRIPRSSATADRAFERFEDSLR